jgi:hypothetical protein
MVTQDTYCSNCKTVNQNPFGNKFNIFHCNIIFSQLSVSSGIFSKRITTRWRILTNIAFSKGFKRHLHISSFTNPCLITSGVLQSQLKIYLSLGLHEEIFAWNSLLIAHNNRTRRKHRRRNIRILITYGKLYTILAVCNRMHGSMNGPPFHSWSPVVVQR